MHFPFPKPKPNPKRTQPRRTGDRVILRGSAKTQRRREIFERSGGKCEAIKRVDLPLSGKVSEWRCNRPITWETMQWSHPDHGPYKDDRYGIASCAECHEVGVHNPKSVPRKPGRRMNQTEALAYWNGDVCFCGETKGKRWSFCFDCLQKLSPQLRDDLEKVIGKDYLATMSEAERELIAWKPAEEQTA